MSRLIDKFLIWLHKTYPLPKPELIVWLRHGESEHNVMPRENGVIIDQVSREVLENFPTDHNVSLTEKGMRQALLTGEGIKKEFGLFDVIYHSGYQRTKQTLDNVLKAYTYEERLQMKIRANHKIAERQAGYTFGVNKEMVDKLYPDYANYSKKYGYFWSKPPGGENQFEVVTRIYSFIGEMFRTRPGQKILVVCHGGVIRAARYNLECWDVEDYQADLNNGVAPNCSVTVYKRDQKNNQLKLSILDQIYY